MQKAILIQEWGIRVNERFALTILHATTEHGWSSLISGNWGFFVGPYVPHSKLLRGVYIGDYVGEYYRGYAGDTWSLDCGSHNKDSGTLGYRGPPFVWKLSLTQTQHELQVQQ